MKVENHLAHLLMSVLMDKQHSFSLTENVCTLQIEDCYTKIRKYIEWIKEMNINSVILISSPSIDALCLSYALVLSNKTYIPVHTSTSAELLATYMQVYEVDLLLVQPHLVNQCNGSLKPKLIDDKAHGFFYYLASKKQETFCLLPGIVFFTSGTTEQTKAVHYHYDTLYRYISWCLEEFKLNRDDHFLFTTELSFIASLRPLFVPILAGANLCFTSHSSSNKLSLIIDTLLKKKITILNITPTLCKVLVQHIEKHGPVNILSPLRLVLLSGEPIDTQLINDWFANIRADCVFYNLYGATEYLVPFYKKIIAPLLMEDQLHLGQLRKGCDYLLISAPNKSYELYVTGEIATAYIDHHLNRYNYMIINDRRYIKTNDFVECHNKELFFCSRAQRMIKRYGQLINLDQIEYVLKQHEKGIDFVAFSDDKNENKIYLVIYGTTNNEDTLSKVKKHLKTYLPNYMHPNEYIFTEDIPLTLSGKIDYLCIKKRFSQDQFFNITDYFKSFFPGKTIDLNKKIMDLGLESIDYLEMADKFYKITGKWLDISKIDDNTRISTIASCLFDLKEKKSTQYDAVPLNLIHHNVYQNQLSKPHDSPFWHCFVNRYCLKGEIDLTRLEKAIDDTLSHHFMLISKLEEINDAFFFVQAKKQTAFELRNPFFFAKQERAKLNISAHSDPLVKIYYQKKKNRFFLIIVYHHLALDGWSVMLAREEIFRRYEGTHTVNPLKRENEIHYLTIANQILPDHDDPMSELKSLFLRINPHEYNQLDFFLVGNYKENKPVLLLKKTW